MPHFSRRHFLAASGAALASTSSRAQAPTRIKFTMEWRYQGPQSLFILAKNKGYFAQEGLDVEVDIGMGSASAIQRIATGAYQAGVGDISTLIEIMGNNPGRANMQAVYMMYDDAPFYIFSLKKHGINTLADLEGKTVSGAVFEFHRKLWPLIARSGRFNPANTKWATVEPALRAQTVIRGDAHAMGGFANAWNEFTGRGIPREEVVALKLSDYGVRLYGNALLVSNALIASNPRAVTGLTRAVNRAFIDMISDVPGAVRALKAQDALINEAIETQNLESMLPFIITDASRSSGIGPINKIKLENQVDQVAQALGLKTPPSAEAIFNSQFLPARAERLPRRT